VGNLIVNNSFGMLGSKECQYAVKLWYGDERMYN
jgi:hypothetical protein